MREIKFRGKCIISGDWVYGDLVHGVGHKDGKMYILPIRINLAYIKHCDHLDGVEVIPETVGQFLGRSDINGKEIYEGDIDYFRWVVCSESGVFCIKQSLSARTFIPIHEANIKSIIGNIYENPELLSK